MKWIWNIIFYKKVNKLCRNQRNWDWCFLVKLCFWRPRESAKSKMWRDFAIIIRISLAIAGLRINNGKNLNWKNWLIFWREKANVQKMKFGDLLEYLRESSAICFRYSLQQRRMCQLQSEIFVLPIQKVQYRFREDK